jgi:two-component system chemotaxis response regulator CheB
MSALKILIVEDSEIASDILTQVLESDQKLHVVGVARNGQEALELIPSLSPNLITMDVWMPVMDGFETVERIMADHPTPILVITSSSLKEDVRLSMRMLEAGALDVIEKPVFNNQEQWETQQRDLTARIKMLAGVKVITHLRGRRNQAQIRLQNLKAALKPDVRPNTSAPSKPSLPNGKTNPPALPVPAKKPNLSLLNSAVVPNTVPQVGRALPNRANPLEPIKANFPDEPFYRAIAIASSTGGPTALLQILQSLPSNLPCGVLLVQHISEGFTQGLVDWLQRQTPLRVKMAQDGDRVIPGLVLVAPDGRDMLVNPNQQIVTSKEGLGLIRPSADVLMRSVAQSYEARSVGLVLTGMGSDGASGLLAMARNGAYTLAQNEATSLIYGMPKAATDNGAAGEVIALSNIATRLVQLLQHPATYGPLPIRRA